jgi:hypothetical protein
MGGVDADRKLPLQKLQILVGFLKKLTPGPWTLNTGAN